MNQSEVSALPVWCFLQLLAVADVGGQGGQGQEKYS